ncbi:MBL fold metallo-hydrolase [Natronoarchaeum rubrum]|uniref:MBL fold metallo-hydrolase n=1 Tax=Natronoarchaeum rubrum TaxID=755311 RepID=UPI0021123C3F|nr:MBL fold metallo-hydrolase [Natronoarchaeum rubrum]
MDPIVRVPISVSGPAPTGRTNAYVLGRSDALLVDPAGESAELERQLDRRAPDAVLTTHAHPDHVGALARYAREYDLDVYARSGYEERFERATGVSPDATLRDGDVLSAGACSVEVTATPGHAPDHVALTVSGADAAPEGRNSGDLDDHDGAVLVGDLAVAEGSVFVGPPDGDMRGYLTALRRLHARAPDELLPGHGPAIARPREVLARLLAHRLDRERTVLAAVRNGAATPDAVVEAAYDKDLSGVRDLARRAVIAHLEKLAVEGAVEWDGERARPSDA